MILLLVLLLTLHQTHQTSQNNLPADYLLTSSLVERGVHVHNGIEIEIGSGHEFSKNIRRFEVNIGYPEILIGNNQKIGWGINCDLDSSVQSNSCKITNEVEEQINFQKIKLKVQSAELHLKLHSTDQINGTDAIKAKAKLISQSEPWPISNWGIIGLSPHSEFVKYIKALYQSDSFEIMLFFINDDEYHFKKEIMFKFRPVINPKYPKEAITSTHSIPENALFWSINGSLEITDKTWNIETTPICLSSTANYLILIENAHERCLAIKKVICSSLTEEVCKKQDSDLDLAPILKITLETKEYLIPSHKYLFYKQNTLECAFGEIKYHRGEDCPENSLFGIGKQFFTDQIPVFKFSKDGSLAVTFLDNYRIEGIEAKLYLHFTILAGLSGLILLAGWSYVIYIAKSPNKDSDDYLGI